MQFNDVPLSIAVTPESAEIFTDDFIISWQINLSMFTSSRSDPSISCLLSLDDWMKLSWAEDMNTIQEDKVFGLFIQYYCCYDYLSQIDNIVITNDSITIEELIYKFSADGLRIYKAIEKDQVESDKEFQEFKQSVFNGFRSDIKRYTYNTQLMQEALKNPTQEMVNDWVNTMREMVYAGYQTIKNDPVNPTPYSHWDLFTRSHEGMSNRDAILRNRYINYRHINKPDLTVKDILKDGLKCVNRNKNNSVHPKFLVDNSKIIHQYGDNYIRSKALINKTSQGPYRTQYRSYERGSSDMYCVGTSRIYHWPAIFLCNQFLNHILPTREVFPVNLEWLSPVNNIEIKDYEVIMNETMKAVKRAKGIFSKTTTAYHFCLNNDIMSLSFEDRQIAVKIFTNYLYDKLENLVISNKYKFYIKALKENSRV